MSPELEAATQQAADTAKAEAWQVFVEAVAVWDETHDKTQPAAMRALADAACEYAGKQVERHVAEAVAEEREALCEWLKRNVSNTWVAGQAILAIRARGQASEAKAHDTEDLTANDVARLMQAALRMPTSDFLATASPSTAPTATATPGEASPLTDRANEAIRRITSGIAPMRIPADPCDADRVIADLLAECDALREENAGKRVQRHVEAAVEREREQCALVVGVFVHVPLEVRAKMQAAIRARGTASEADGRAMEEVPDGEWCRWADVESREAYWRNQVTEAGRNAAAGAQAVRDEAYAMNERLTNEVEALAADNARLKTEVETAYGTAMIERLNAENARLRAALEKIDAIRNSIVGLQQINWSAHIYPLVAALGEAGFKGEGHEVARAKSLELFRQRDIAVAALRRLVEHGEGCISEPDCGSCKWCDAVAALAKVAP